MPWHKEGEETCFPATFYFESGAVEKNQTSTKKNNYCYDMQKRPSGHQRLLFLSYVTLNCYVITSDYSRVSSRVTRKKTYFIIRESLSRCCCFVSSKGNLPLKWLKFVFKEAYWTQTHYLALSRLKGQNYYCLWKKDRPAISTQISCEHLFV